MPVTRRSFVSSAIGAGVTLSAGTPVAALARRKPKERLVVAGGFPQGIGSGFPTTSGIVLWTALDGVSGNAKVKLEVARDADFRNVVLARDVRVPAVRDHTVHTQVSGLDAGEQYYYRFHTKTVDSAAGRFRTARPADSAEPVRIGFFSCQDYQAGYYPSHAALAREDDLDLVLCLGDYVYEQTYYHGPRSGQDKSGGRYKPDDPAYVVTLEEWRAKYRLYKSDPQLQAMHAAHPFVSIWDDHEVEDNYAGGKRDSAKTAALPYDFAQRRRDAYLAFFEYMPRLRSKPVSTSIYGVVPLGRTVDLFLTDERQYRDQQPCGDALLVPCADDNIAGRKFLGDAQKAWFKDAVPKSQATWKLVANELMIMSLDSVPGLALNQDSWDGYAAERQEILEHFAASGVRNLSFLTGDIHSFFAGNVSTSGRGGGKPIATEFVGGSISSLGLENTFPGPTVTAAELALPLTNPQLAYANLTRRGYAIVEARPDVLKVAYRSPLTNAQRDSPVSTIASFRVLDGNPSVERLA
jgi:alkaline phosphatase D